MHDDKKHRALLDQKAIPVAILHAGMYVYANPAFLRLFGYRSFSEIEGIPVLDMVTAAGRDHLREHFRLARSTILDAPSLPAAKLSMITHDGTPLDVIASSHSTLFSDEQCLEVWLRPLHGTLSQTERPARIPWRLYLSLVFLCLFTLLPPALLLELNIDNDPKVYFPDDEPAVVIDKALREHFPNDQVFILLFEGDALFSDNFLNAYHQLTRQLEHNPLVEKVFGLTTQDHIAGSEDGFLVEPVINTRELAKTTPVERQQRAIADRFARNALVSSDGSAISLIVVSATLENSMQRLQLGQDVLSAVQEVHLEDYLTARTGFVPQDIAELRSMLQDNMIFIPATVCIGLFLIWWLFRRWLAVILGGISIGVVVGSTVVLYVLTDQPFTLISSIVPPLLSALTVAALVHLYNALHYAAQRGMAGSKRVAYAISQIRRPALFTALTTAAGLMALATSPIPAIRTFGLISAAGVMFIYLVMIIILPPILARWDSKPWPHNRAGLRWMDIFVRRLYRLGIRHPVWIVILTTATIGAGIPALWQIRVETSLQEFFTPEHPVRKDTNHFESKMSGTGSLDVIFETRERDGLKKPEHLAFMRHFQTWVEQLPEVDKTVSPADFIEEMHWGFNVEDPAFRRIPDNPKLISQYLLVYDGEDLFDFVDREFRISHVSLSINVHPANEIQTLMEKIRTFLHKEIPEGLQWEIAGNSRLFADMEELLITGQIYSVWGALGLIFLLMLILWRSFGSAVLCMIPNVSPILLIFIVMGLFGLWLDMATAMIASVAVGIAVDDTIHVYHGYNKRIKAGIGPVLALVRTFRQAGRAVVTTTIILSAQFMILVLSLFQPTAHFGLLTSIGLWAALVFDLLLLPAIIILLATLKKGVSRPNTS
jgi:predicted RND superfamily exporter protein